MRRCVYLFSILIPVFTSWLSAPAARATDDAVPHGREILASSADGVDEATIAGVNDCQQVGALITRLPGGQVYRGNAFRMQKSVSLYAFGIVLDIDPNISTTVHLSVHESEDLLPYLQSFNDFINIPTDPTRNGPRLFSVELSSPLLLEEGRVYVIGAAWGNSTLIYGRDPAQVSAPGTILPTFPFAVFEGSASRSINELPAPEELVVVPSASGGPFAMEYCVTEACCLGSSCQNLPSIDCQAMGGIETAPGTRCSEIDCPLEVAACCTGQFCSLQNQYECEDDGGEWFEGITCSASPVLCIPKGACCTTMGTCVDNVTEASCTTINGVYRGDDTTCGSVSPQCNRGACCVSPGDCDLRFGPGTGPGQCNESDGAEWQGFGVSCDDTECLGPAGPGACCLPFSGGNCASDLTEELCNLASGVHLGEGTVCPGDNTCQGGSCCLANGSCVDGTIDMTCGGEFTPGTNCTASPCAGGGACCLPNDSCEILVEGFCLEVNGFFQGNGSSCTGQVCARGACCDGDVCEETLEIDCLGTYLGDDVDCVADGCQVGACCVDAGGGSFTCELLTAAECASSAGTFVGDGTTCDMAPCLFGGCCRADGTCDNDVFNFQCDGALDTLSVGFDCVPSACDSRGACCLGGNCGDEIPSDQCTNLGGIAGEPGSLCADVVNPCVGGACCLSDGTCEELSNLECVTMGGSFTADTMCDGVTCPQPGACCLPGGCSEDYLESTCMDEGGTFVGEATVCEALACTAGACCQLDDSCSETLGFQCVDSGGDFTAGFTCASVMCDPFGACCLSDGACMMLTSVDCFLSLGTYAGDNVDCSANTCERGACCQGDGKCVDDQLGYECEPLGGTLEPGAACLDVTCEPRGACCVGSDCTVETAVDCGTLGGTYEGDGTTCDDVTCNPLTLLLSVPDSNAIDARQPTSIDGSIVYGWDGLSLVFSADASGVSAGDFSVTSTSGTAPGVLSVSPAGNLVVVTFDGPIPPGAWTQITYVPSGESACLGFLPSDVNSDRVGSPSDILAVIDALNGITARPIYSTDADRSGLAGPEDILRTIDLLNGAGTFDAWFDAQLGASPCDP